MTKKHRLREIYHNFQKVILEGIGLHDFMFPSTEKLNTLLWKVNKLVNGLVNVLSLKEAIIHLKAVLKNTDVSFQIVIRDSITIYTGQNRKKGSSE